jgi:hypothetical protein
MNRTALLLIGSLAVVGCGDGNEASEGAATAAPDSSGSGSFTGHIGERSYKVNVSCAYLDKDYFTFLSDRTDSSDTNGDGIIISGMQNGKKLVFTVIDNGKKYSTGNLTTFEKSATGVRGSGTLFEDGANGQVDADFSVDCG